VAYFIKEKSFAWPVEEVKEEPALGNPIASHSTAFKVPSEASQESSPDRWFIELMTDDCPLRSTIIYCMFSIISSYIDVEQQRSVGTLLHHINKKRLPKQHIRQFTTDFFS